HVRERVRPVLEYRLVDALRPLQVFAPVFRNARIEDLMVAALDNVDGVDLHIAKVLDRCADRFRAVAERRGLVQALGTQPQAPRACPGQRRTRRHQASRVSGAAVKRASQALTPAAKYRPNA